MASSVSAQQVFNPGVDLRARVPDPSGSAAPAVRALLSLARTIGAIGGVARVAAQFAADRAGVSGQCPGDRADRQPLPSEHGQGVSFRLGELVVHRGSSLAGGIPFSLPAHLFIPGRRECCTYFVNSRGLTIRSSRCRFAARLNSGVRHDENSLATQCRTPARCQFPRSCLKPGQSPYDARIGLFRNTVGGR